MRIRILNKYESADMIDVSTSPLFPQFVRGMSRILVTLEVDAEGWEEVYRLANTSIGREAWELGPDAYRYRHDSHR